jgi:4-hydroxy-3-methylbut-2-enyl diphosphate reductase
MSKPKLSILLANPRGFCAGVDRAIEIVERALVKYGAPVYVRHEIVHNKQVLADLRAKGAVFVKDLSEVPAGAQVIFSAHGVAKSVPLDAAARGLNAIDATCPLVTKVHNEAMLRARQGYHLLLIGHAGHPEVVGTMGQLEPGQITLIETLGDVEKLPFGAAEKLAYITQTTLSVDETADIIAALKQRYPDARGPTKDDICYATTNRQVAVKDLAQRCAVVVVMGSANSSNSNRLVEVARAYGAKEALLADTAAQLPWDKWQKQSLTTLGLTAGASAPEALVQGVIEAAKTHFDVTVTSQIGTPENITFNLPRHLIAS